MPPCPTSSGPHAVVLSLDLRLRVYEFLSHKFKQICLFFLYMRERRNMREYK